MIVNFCGELRKVTKEDWVSKKDPSVKGTSFYITIECLEDSYKFQTTNEVFTSFCNGSLEKGVEYEFLANYNPRFSFNQFIVQKACFIE